MKIKIFNKANGVAMAVLFVGMASLSCNPSDDKKETLEVTATKKEDGSTVIASDTSKKIASTSMVFVESVHDFGKIKEGIIVEYDFKFKNTGKYPLVISDAKASCGCTIPEWTKDPVLPNEEGKLKVKYNSAGKEGKIHKTISVYANTNPELTTIDINVEVERKDDSMGPIKK